MCVFGFQGLQTYILYGFSRFGEEGGAREDPGRPPFLLLLQYTFLIQLLFETDANPRWLAPPLPVHLPYSILVQNWWKSSLATPSSPSTHFLFIIIEYDESPLLCPIPSPSLSTHSLSNSFSKQMKKLSSCCCCYNHLGQYPRMAIRLRAIPSGKAISLPRASPL